MWKIINILYRLKIRVPKGPLKIMTIFRLPTTVGRHWNLICWIARYRSRIQTRRQPQHIWNHSPSFHITTINQSWKDFKLANGWKIVKLFQVTCWDVPSRLRSVHWLMFVKGRFPKFWMSRWSRYTVYFFKLPKEDLGMKWYILQHFEPKAKESFGNSKKFKGCLDSEVSEVLLLSYFVSEFREPVESLEDPFQRQEQQEQQHQAIRTRNQLQRQPGSKFTMQNKHTCILQLSCLSDLSSIV